MRRAALGRPFFCRSAGTAILFAFDIVLMNGYEFSMIRIIGTIAILSLAACGPAENDPGPGGVTVGEAKALDEAAEMLDERNAPPRAQEDRDNNTAQQ